eukprot:1005329-Pelagomonas_calceolata.AAC.1
MRGELMWIGWVSGPWPVCVLLLISTRLRIAFMPTDGFLRHMSSQQAWDQDGQQDSEMDFEIIEIHVGMSCKISVSYVILFSRGISLCLLCCDAQTHTIRTLVASRLPPARSLPKDC